MIDPTFKTDAFFSGGSGMFLQYHDIVKPIYLYATIKMMMSKHNYGLPVDIIKDFTILSIMEWYMKRRYVNPLRQLDFNHCTDPDLLDKLMKKILVEDPSIYKLAPPLSAMRLFDVYRKQHMSFPVFVYTEEEEPEVMRDLNNLFGGIRVTYLFGDLYDAIKKCDQNYTYIFSDISLAKKAAEILVGTCSHILLARDYRYNFTDNCKTFKYDLKELARAHPFVRIGTTLAVDPQDYPKIFANLSSGGDS